MPIACGWWLAWSARSGGRDGAVCLVRLTNHLHLDLNPVRAGLAATPEAWIWSSCPGYFRRRDSPGLGGLRRAACAWAGEFGRTDPEASYRRFVAAGLTTRPAPPVGRGAAWLAPRQ